MGHEVGTARLGNRAATSVFGPDQRGWDVRNLFIGDGASFPSVGCQSPSLTMMALAARAGDKAADWLRTTGGRE